MKFIFLAFLLTSCATKKIPEFVFDKTKFCEKDELCAVGNAPEINMAQVLARSELAKIFNNRVESSFQSTLSEKESFNVEQIKETSDYLLQGTEIVKVEKVDNEFYVLAKLNKNKLAKLYKDEALRIDDEINVLVSTKKLLSLDLAIKKEEEREVLNQKHYFLRNQNINFKYKKKDLLEIKKSQAYSLEINFSGDTTLKNYLKDKLSEVGFVFNNNPQFTVWGSVLYKEEHLNVKGFVKYTAIFNLQTEDRNKTTIGSLHFEEGISARNLKQAQEKARMLIYDYISSDLYKLEI